MVWGVVDVQFKNPKFQSEPQRFGQLGIFRTFEDPGTKSNGDPPPPNGQEPPLSTATSTTNPPPTAHITAIVYHPSQKDPQSPAISKRCPHRQKVVHGPRKKVDSRGMSAVWDSAGKRNAVTILQFLRHKSFLTSYWRRMGTGQTKLGLDIGVQGI
jgi:hypothetical protein